MKGVDVFLRPQLPLNVFLSDGSIDSLVRPPSSHNRPSNTIVLHIQATSRKKLLLRFTGKQGYELVGILVAALFELEPERGTS